MRTAKLAVALCLFLVVRLAASGPTGVFAVIEKVVFEPNEANAERIQLWGAFSFVNGNISSSTQSSTPARGYLYFSLPDGTAEQVKVVRNEWADLKAMAGTGQAVAFGQWMFIGAFNTTGPSQIYITVQDGPRSFRGVPLVLHTQAPPRVEPAPYVTNTGLVKLSADGSHAAIVKQLKDALAR